MAENAALTGMPIVSHIHPNFLGASINSSTSEKKWELCMIVPTICGDGPGGGSS